MRRKTPGCTFDFGHRMPSCYASEQLLGECGARLICPYLPVPISGTYPHYPKMSSWRGDERAGNIRIQAGTDHVLLMYTCTPHGSDPQACDYSVRIERAPCHFGGVRPGFGVPALVRSRRDLRSSERR